MLEDIGINEKTGKLIMGADTAFLLPEVENFQDKNASPSKSIAIVPSRVIADKLPDYTEQLVGIAKSLHASGWGIEVIVHSWRENDHQIRNNDIPVAREIVQRLQIEGIPVQLTGYGLDSGQIRSAIGRNTVVLTSRFHGMIAALSEARPVVVVGWSHKYAEVLHDFGMEDQCIPYDSFTVAGTIAKIEYCGEQAEQFVARIRERLPAVQRAAEAQFTEAFRRLEGSHG
jgi:polysaccharide pyruvyl transferase WcaK-like protein